VVTIQMSNQRVPRWLTEGISEFEQKRARPEWARQMDLEFAAMMNEDKVIKLRDLNAAFTDPRKISIAYFQGSIVVDYLFETYGQPGVNKLLREFGKGLDSDAALKSALDTANSVLTFAKFGPVAAKGTGADLESPSLRMSNWKPCPALKLRSSSS